MNIETLTLKEIREISSILNENRKQDDSHWVIGKNYFIRTVTHHFTGKLEKVTSQELVLSNCCWIADDGRFHNAMKGEGFSEQEPYLSDSHVIIGRGSLIDATIYNFELPISQKS